MRDDDCLTSIVTTLERSIGIVGLCHNREREDLAPMGYDDTELEKRSQDADDAALSASSRIPDLLTWGMFSYGDASPAIGGGVGGFQWFESKACLLDFVGSHLPFNPPGPAGSDVEAVLGKVKAILDRLGNHETEDESARLELNIALRHFSQIQWWGTFGDLLTTNCTFTRDVRTWFRENSGDPNPTDHPINAADRRAFLNLIGEYGL